MTPAAGWDMLLWKAPPTPVQLMQQAALAACAVADPSAIPQTKRQRDVIVDLLEEVFQCISDQKTVLKYKDALEDWDIDIKRFQFCLMRILCVLYAEVRAL
jgi:hypothetical protein